MDILNNIGTGELIFLLIIVLLVMGPHRLPEITRMLGQTLRKVQETYQEFVSEFEEELRTVGETSKEVRESVQTLKEAADLPRTPLKAATETTASRLIPEAIDALPTHDLAPHGEAKEDNPADD
jgi:sec-independent protein translocase protein TatB